MAAAQHASAQSVAFGSVSKDFWPLPTPEIYRHLIFRYISVFSVDKKVDLFTIATELHNDAYRDNDEDRS